MVLYEINKQCESFMTIAKWLKGVESDKAKNQIWSLAATKWLDDPEHSVNTGYGDWQMVWYEIDKQQKAMAEY